jgi:hypothetical protein
MTISFTASIHSKPRYNNQGCAVIIAQHYTQVTVVMTAERLYRGEAPTQISFLTE